MGVGLLHELFSSFKIKPVYGTFWYEVNESFINMYAYLLLIERNLKTRQNKIYLSIKSFEH